MNNPHRVHSGRLPLRARACLIVAHAVPTWQVVPILLLNPTASPFRLRCRSSDAYPHESWQRAQEQALAALRRGESIAVLGLPGTGKTLLLQHLAHCLSTERVPVTVQRHPVMDGAGATDMLLVDEADSLSLADLQELCGRVSVFALAGLPEFTHSLGGLPRSVVPITLAPLSSEEIARFLVSRLRESGRPATIFEPEAVIGLATHSAGLMRLVVMLAGSALFLAEQEGAEQVTRRHVEEAAALRIDTDDSVDAPLASEPAQHIDPAPALPRPTPRRSNRRYGPALAIAACALAGIGLWAAVPRSVPTPTLAITSPKQTMAQQDPLSKAIPEPELARPTPPAVPIVLPPALPTQPSLDAQATAPSATEPTMTFRGPVMNVTMQQGGQLALMIRQREPGRITIDFRASSGLIGAGQMTGTMTGDGRISATGRLMMGRNPFDCVLNAVSDGDTLIGEAHFTRVGTNSSAHGTFNLSRRS